MFNRQIILHVVEIINTKVLGIIILIEVNISYLFFLNKTLYIYFVRKCNDL